MAAPTFPADPADERTHEPGGEDLWNESWYFDFVTDDGSLGGYVRIGLYPNLDAVWYWACLVGEHRHLVTVIDHEVAQPTRSSSLELRAEGLWADHNCEEPLERWSLGLEAFAVAMDDPAEVYRGGYGARVPFGFELEWETAGEVFRYPIGLDRYEIPCRVHGEVLVGDETLAIEAVGQRDHSWGTRDWWTMGWCWTAFHLDDGTHWHMVVTKPDSFASFGYRQRPGEPLELVTDFTVDEMVDADGIPTAAVLRAAGHEVTFTPTAWSPVLLAAPDGRLSRFPRGQGHFVDATGATGVGWIEFNQPQGPD